MLRPCTIFHMNLSICIKLQLWIYVAVKKKARRGNLAFRGQTVGVKKEGVAFFGEGSPTSDFIGYSPVKPRFCRTPN